MSKPQTAQAERRMYEVGIESRRRILDAAEQLIAERGFEKTSIVEISRLSGVSRGSIPWHFTNKDGILLAVVDRITARSFDESELETGELPSVHEVLARLATLARGDGGRLLFTVLNQATTATGPVREQYQQFYANKRHEVDTWLKIAGVRSAKMRKSLAAAIVAGFLGATLQWIVDPDDVDLETTIDSLAAMVEDHLPR